MAGLWVVLKAMAGLMGVSMDREARRVETVAQGAARVERAPLVASWEGGRH